MNKFLIVCFGGAIGSALRYATGLWLSKSIQSTFPYSTLTVNLVGCFLIGMFYALSQRYQWFTPEWRIFLLPAFVGVLLPSLLLLMKM